MAGINGGSEIYIRSRKQGLYYYSCKTIHDQLQRSNKCGRRAIFLLHRMQEHIQLDLLHQLLHFHNITRLQIMWHQREFIVFRQFYIFSRFQSSKKYNYRNSLVSSINSTISYNSSVISISLQWSNECSTREI